MHTRRCCFSLYSISNHLFFGFRSFGVCINLMLQFSYSFHFVCVFSRVFVDHPSRGIWILMLLTNSNLQVCTKFSFFPFRQILSEKKARLNVKWHQTHESHSYASKMIYCQKVGVVGNKQRTTTNHMRGKIYDR